MMTPNEVPLRLMALIQRLTWHTRAQWEAEDYDGDDDGRLVTTDIDLAEVVASGYSDNTGVITTEFDDLPSVDSAPSHALLVDVDCPAWLIPSSTEGHGHLYAETYAEWDAICAWLDASVAIGLVEEGWAHACKSRGMLSLRLPWIEKGNEPDHSNLEDLDQTPADDMQGLAIRGGWVDEVVAMDTGYIDAPRTLHINEMRILPRGGIWYAGTMGDG